MYRSAMTIFILFTALAIAQEPKKKRVYVKSMPDTDFTKRDLHGENYAKHDLENCIFHFCDMKGIILQGSNLRGADFGSASLDKADMSDCILQSAKFDRAGADSANFNGSDLRGADLSRCSCQKASFRGADLRNIKGLQDMTGADFTDADIRGANLQDTREYATKAIFKGAKYDKLTRWPRGYDPEKAGAVLVKPE